jgi:cellulose synthase/poly-beta-1,6-N-acetylglucosamine synthase-like glycosyltransferase
VTVQLPVFNEVEVVERLVRAAAALDYPRHLLDLQLLDDSTDETTHRIERLLPTLHAEGISARHLRRTTRDGFKAGALAAGMEEARGDHFLVLDADFVPPPDLLLRLLPSFADPRVGMVQARWDHLNEGARLLTRARPFSWTDTSSSSRGGVTPPAASSTSTGPPGCGGARRWRRPGDGHRTPSPRTLT